MKKKLMTLALVLAAFGFSVKAQNARETTVSINKSNQAGFVADYAYSKDLMEKTLEGKLSKAGLSKSKKHKGGFRKYEGVVLSEVSPNKVDIYTKVEGKKNTSNVMILVSTGYDNFVGANSDAAAAQNVMNLLNNLNSEAAVMNASIALDDQQKKVKEAEEAMKKAEKEKEKLQKKKADMEKEIEKAQSAQDNKMKALEEQRARLEQMKAAGMQ